tara:strand:- start:506 stop:826 length:321 start_codon:yes stop_codon:yes gene_type:complete
MGLFDTVWVQCEISSCYGRISAQTKALDMPILRNIDLDNAEALAEEFTSEELCELKVDIQNKEFGCISCGNSYIPFPSSTGGDKIALAEELFNVQRKKARRGPDFI